MRIALVTTTDARDRRSWSGIFHGMLGALERHVGSVDCIGPLRSPLVPVGKAVDRATRLALGRAYDWSHSTVVARSYVRTLDTRLARKHYDFIFAPAAATAIAFLRTQVPIIYSSDATVALSEQYYRPERTLAFSKRAGENIERLAIRRARMLVYPTNWVASSAIHEYGALPDRVHVIPYGANLESPPAREEIGHRRPGPVCRLLLLGVDWDRKGGDVAVEALEALRRRGIPAELTVCGCTPPSKLRGDGLRVIPFLDKNEPGDRLELHRLLLNSDFLILPTRAEAYGIVFCEAAAYGLPVLSAATGGVPDVVTHGVTGVLLPPASRGDAYAAVAWQLWRDSERYETMAAAARDAYDLRLNWAAWGRRVGELLNQMAASPRRP